MPPAPSLDTATTAYYEGHLKSESSIQPATDTLVQMYSGRMEKILRRSHLYLLWQKSRSPLLGDKPQGAWLTTDPKKNWPLKIGDYCCFQRELNPFLPTKPGEPGCLYVIREDELSLGVVYPFFIAAPEKPRPDHSLSAVSDSNSKPPHISATTPPDSYT
ncbi:hypothetical protein RUND412_011208 [Rhizina undulata]